MSRITSNKGIEKRRTDQEMRDALDRLCKAVHSRTEVEISENRRACFSLPPQENDADIVLMDAINDLLEVRNLLDEARRMINSLINDCEQCVSFSHDRNLSTKARAFNKRVDLEFEPVENKRLILSIIRHFDENGEENEAKDELHLARVKTMKTAFAKRFPDAPKFHQTSQVCESFSDWKYFFSGALPEHIEWAKDASRCGLIDNFLVDY